MSDDLAELEHRALVEAYAMKLGDMFGALQDGLLRLSCALAADSKETLARNFRRGLALNRETLALALQCLAPEQKDPA
jgi:hypothetical protein